MEITSVDNDDVSDDDEWNDDNDDSNSDNDRDFQIELGLPNHIKERLNN